MAKQWRVGDRILNRWEIHKVLLGGMGVVYVVYDHELHEALAAKTFQAEAFAYCRTLADRFMQEAVTWVRLGYHQNITHARFAEVVQGKPFLFLEYVSGGDLGNWIGSPRLTENLTQVLLFGMDFCEGMNYAASKGIIAHRDIKPANCLITPDGILKVTDFGLAKVYDDVLETATSSSPSASPSSGLSCTGVGVGTALYMAPEQFSDAKRVDIRADVYSFGVMLFEMLTGACPFRASTWEELEWLHMTKVPPRLRTHPLLGSVFERCLAKDPDLRFADFVQVGKELAAAYAQVQGTVAKRKLGLRKIAHIAGAYVETLRKDPGSSKVSGSALRASECLNKGASLAALGRSKEAITCYDRALEFNPLDAVTWSNKGAAFDLLGRKEEALACHDKAIECNPGDPFAWSNKGDSLREEGRNHEAVACYDCALELDRHHVSAWLNKAVALAKLGKNELALTCSDRVIELDPRSENAWTNRGLILSAMDRDEEALYCHEKAIAMSPDDAVIWINKGFVLGRLGKAQEEIDCYDRALELNPMLEEAWFNKGEALDRLGRAQEGIECYDRALELNPGFTGAWLNRGVALGALGRTEEEIQCYDRALELEPRNEEVWANKGMALVNLGKATPAIDCCERALKLNSTLPQAWFYKGVALGMLERRKEEIDCYDRTLALDDKSAEAWFRKGIRTLSRGHGVPGEGPPPRTSARCRGNRILS